MYGNRTGVLRHVWFSARQPIRMCRCGTDWAPPLVPFPHQYPWWLMEGYTLTFVLLSNSISPAWHSLFIHCQDISTDIRACRYDFEYVPIISVFCLDYNWWTHFFLMVKIADPQVHNAMCECFSISVSCHCKRSRGTPWWDKSILLFYTKIYT